MKEIALSEIHDLDDGMPIPQLSGHIKIVFDRKAGEGQYGPWSFQDAVLTNGEAEATIKFKNMEDMRSLQGKDVTIRANKSKQHGLTGVVKIVHQHEGKIYHKVQLTESCKIVVGLPNGSNEAEILENEGDFVPTHHDAKGNSLAEVDEAKRHITQAANLYNLCANKVNEIIEPNIKNMTAELFQSAVASLFIESSRAGMISKMPETNL